MKGYRDNASGAGGFGARSKTVYDDVFGGPPKFGATTLPPRIEDYTEIFQGFHASRGSSIPVLDLPPPAVNSDDVWFDVSSSKLDYSEVFGGFNGLDFAYSYEELFESSKVAEDDSSDDVWTPAQSESLSEESDLQASLETNQQVFTADRNMDLKTEPNFEADKDLLNEMTDDSQCLDVSGFGVLDNQVLPPKTENNNYFSLVNNNLYASKDFGQAAEEKKLKKSLSGLSLKTQPSNLPPPSRPPPGLTLKKGDFGNFTSKLKTSKSYAFDRTTVDQSPPFFDVEIDASSSAAADAAAMKDAVEQAQAKLKSAKALMDRKKKVKENDFEGEKMKRLFKSGSGRNENQQNHQNAVISEPNVGSTESKHNSETVEETVENEMFENLIEIQLKDNDIVTMEKVVTETWFKNDDNEIKGDETGPASNMWVDYDIEPEEATEKTEERFEKGFQQAGPPAMSSIHSEESDNISETVSEETLDHDEKMLSAEERIKTEIDEKIETIYEVDCSLEESLNLRELVSENESVKWDEDESITGENLEEERETERLRRLEEECEIERLRKLEEEREIVRLRKLEEERENERLRRLDEERENERLRREEERENERLRKLEKERETERLRKLEEERETERLRKLEKERETERLRRLEEERETERLRKLEEERETERLRKLEERETERLRKLEEERENERLRKLEEERETKRLRKLEKERETERLRRLEDERETERLRREEERENERLRKLEEERETERLRALEKERETERLRKLEKERETERLKLEEERERQIEREKDRMAVDRATLEAREKTFAETRERATIERATAEFRQRALAEARERLEKACAEARERSLADKAMEGRLRVEKATAEARERAVSDKFSYQNTGIRQNSLPSDLSGSYSGLRYYQAPTQGVGEDESPQRCKARLERHQRTADRAAKALAEKNMRDLIAQKEQAERSRLAEGLDAEVKRWSSGKQGNLRALLSTLQYILGADSGWQPVPLTEVITTAAVKKAYRKATLCVHPDKLQQRGATIQQKYVCEKVFDLLKEAWNKFNSEER